MQSNIPNREDRLAEIATTDETSLHDLAELWRDLGGSD